MTDQPAEDTPVMLNPDLPDAAQDKPLSPAARRAAAPPLDLPPEQGGPRGAEPTRYGDWEKKGLAVDF